jgi:cell division protease FtsH
MYQQPITVKTLIDGMENHEFNRIYFSPDMRKVTAITPNMGVRYDTTITPLLTEKLVDISLKNDVEPVFMNYEPNVFSMLPNLIFPILILLFLRNMAMMRNAITGGTDKSSQGFFGLGNIPTKIRVPTNVTFADWAGSEEVLEECTEFVSYMRNNTFYKKAGAVLPRGILLEGPPGTGKTLLAKAIATESNSSFISISGSEFIEMFVGVGALRVRKLFEEARANLPCIVFIDEIDAIGKQRGREGFMGGNDEREQTLNQLLTEMDGFNKNDGLIIIAATNRMDTLDSALLRPGRFDRIVRIPLPDTKSREAILKVHLRNKTIDSTVDIESLSKITVGYSGAKLKNIVNEAAIFAAREQEVIITNNYLLDSIEKAEIGIKKNTDNRDDETKRRIAIHEIGHGFIANHFSEYFDLQKITIQATYSGAAGYTLFTEKYDIAENGLYTKDLLLKRLMVALGGKAAEAVFYGDDFVSVGATMDLRQANGLAREMIERYGMGNKLQVFYREEGYGQTYSEMTESQIDKEVSNLVNEAYYRAKDLLETNYNMIDFLSERLVLYVILTGGQVKQFIKNSSNIKL